MPSDVPAIAPLGSLTSAYPTTAPHAGVVPAPTVPAPKSTPHASPVSLLDPTSGLVVLAFYDAKGDETASLPAKHQLDLYRRNEPSLDIFQPAIRDDVIHPTTVPTGLPAQA